VTDEPSSPRFLSGRAVLVTNIHRLFNGLSVFGVAGTSRPQIEVGTFILDDAHACLSIVEEKFTLRLPSEHPAYVALVDLFRDDLRAHSAPTYHDFEAGDRTAVLPIPYWAWMDRQSEVLRALHPHRGDEALRFSWPLVSDTLLTCRVAVSAQAIEIAPPCPPVDRVPVFARAPRRVYLTATLADDGVLVSHFGADPTSVTNPITPKTADDLGDRLILRPGETHPSVDDESVRAFVAAQAEKFNVVVIAPSHRRAADWRQQAEGIYDASTIHDVVARLRSEHVGLVVLVNKYDGIDLPEDACRLLVIDGLPEARGVLAQLDVVELYDGKAGLPRQVQRIEQGMGRGVRSNDDHCVVMLLGSRLTQRLHSATAKAMFSDATRRQLELSERLEEQIRDRPFSEIQDAIDQCLGRDEGWVSISRDALDGASYGTGAPFSPAARARRVAFDLASRQQYAEAAQTLRLFANDVTEPLERGVVMQQAATYLHAVDAVAAQELQVAALRNNAALLRPRTYTGQLTLRAGAEQARDAAQFLRSAYGTRRALVLGLTAIVDELRPDPDALAVRAFEQAICDLGEHLGFRASRPEQQLGNGPDGLWMLGSSRVLVIECKSGATTDSISRRDIEQLTHSMTWFRETYDQTLQPTPVMIHPVRSLHPQASALPGTQIITFSKLEELRAAVRKFAGALAAVPEELDASVVRARLREHGLLGASFAATWGRPARSA
jgi:hypothetical protein